MKSGSLLSKIKKFTRDFFSLSKAEQYGIIVLISLILFFILVYFIMPLLIPDKVYDNPKIIAAIRQFKMQQQHIADSLNVEKIQSTGQLSEALAKERLHPFAFDPNKLPRETWLKLGLTNRQIDVIKNYEAKGGKFYTKDDLKKLYSISEAEYNLLKPYIVIKPVFSVKGDEIIDYRKKNKTKFVVTDLNRADTNLLKNNLGFPFWLGRRVVAYRKKLGGFYSKTQLLEVYGLQKKYYLKIVNYLVVDTTQIKKICINQTGFKQLLRHPYCNYKLTKQIFDARKKAGGAFSNLQQVKAITRMSSTGLKLQHYLYICASDLRDK